MPRQQIDQRFFDTPYYVAPNEPVAQEAFAVIREAIALRSRKCLQRPAIPHRWSREVIFFFSVNIAGRHFFGGAALFASLTGECDG